MKAETSVTQCLNNRKMSLEKFNLSWNEYGSWTKNTFQDLLSDHEFTDVTLACEDDRQIKAHKVILSACSQFFRRILVKNPHGNPLIYLKGVKFAELNSILEFIYIGQTEVAQNDVESFMAAAKDLKIKGLLQEATKDNTKSNYKREMVEDYKEDQTHFKEVAYENSFENYPVESTEDNLANGISTNAEVKNDQNKYPCDFCSYQTKFSKDLRNHIKSKHEGQKYSCDGCEKIYTHPNALRQHVRSVHEGIRYPCDQCEHKSTEPSGLRSHKQSKHSF